MAHAQSAERTFTPSATNLIAAAALAVVLAISAAIVAFDPIGRLTDGPDVVSPAVLRSEIQWELQRYAELGYHDPATESARQWERQRRQQSVD
jgi:hypothetical protein